MATPRYWVEGKQVKFYYLGGIVGVEKDFISKIEKSDIDEEEKTVSTVKPELLRGCSATPSEECIRRGEVALARITYKMS